MVKNEMGLPITKETELKIIAVTKSNGDKYLFSIERIEHFIKTQTGWDFKFKIVPVNTVTHGDCETS